MRQQALETEPGGFRLPKLVSARPSQAATPRVLLTPPSTLSPRSPDQRIEERIVMPSNRPSIKDEKRCRTLEENGMSTQGCHTARHQAGGRQGRQSRRRVARPRPPRHILGASSTGSAIAAPV